MEQFQDYKKHFLLFAECGFIAINQGDEDSAIKLFRAAEILNPKNFLPKIGYGYLHLCKLELKHACRFFEEVLAAEPNNEMAKAFLGLGLALTTTEVSKGEKILEECAKKGAEPMIKSLAETALDFVHRFIKKAPGPLEVKPETK